MSEEGCLTTETFELIKHKVAKQDPRQTTDQGAEDLVEEGVIVKDGDAKGEKVAADEDVEDRGKDDLSVQTIELLPAVKEDEETVSEKETVAAYLKRVPNAAVASAVAKAEKGGVRAHSRQVFDVSNEEGGEIPSQREDEGEEKVLTSGRRRALVDKHHHARDETRQECPEPTLLCDDDVQEALLARQKLDVCGFPKLFDHPSDDHDEQQQQKQRRLKVCFFFIPHPLLLAVAAVAAVVVVAFFPFHRLVFRSQHLCLVLSCCPPSLLFLSRFVVCVLFSC